MSLEHLALGRADDLPIKHEGQVHNGKVRAVYWLPKEETKRLITEEGYNSVREDTQLGVMVITDRISAFDCNWRGEDGLQGVPGKGSALNEISRHWFHMFKDKKVADNHIVDVPHPLVWIVQRAQPVRIEAIARQYITGGMLREYEAGAREFCGVALPEGLKQHQKLERILLTPTTKGTLRGIPGVPEEEDTSLTMDQILKSYHAFGFQAHGDVFLYGALTKSGFSLISQELEKTGQIFVDTKFEFGYIDCNKRSKLIFIDEVGTPDSSRIWPQDEYSKGKIVERSKEGFRQFLLSTLDRDVLLGKKRLPERKELAASYSVPVPRMMEVSETYRSIAELITGRPLPHTDRPREEILDTLNRYKLVK